MFSSFICPRSTGEGGAPKWASSSAGMFGQRKPHPVASFESLVREPRSEAIRSLLELARPAVVGQFE